MIVMFLVCFAIAPTRGATKIGNFITPCSLKDPQIESCLLTQAKAMFPHLISGVKDWNVPSLNPLHVSNVTLTDSGNNAVNLKLSGANLEFTGYHDMEIESVKADVGKMHFEFTVKIPEFTGQGKYEMKGRVLLLPINGQGDFDFIYYNLHATCSFDFKPVEENGMKFLKLIKIKFNVLEIPRSRHNFENLFGNKQLSDNMNKVLNENSYAFYSELKTRIDGAFASTTFTIFEQMFNHVPITDLFKDVD